MLLNYMQYKVRHKSYFFNAAGSRRCCKLQIYLCKIDESVDISCRYRTIFRVAVSSTRYVIFSYGTPTGVDVDTLK